MASSRWCPSESSLWSLADNSLQTLHATGAAHNWALLRRAAFEPDALAQARRAFTSLVCKQMPQRKAPWPGKAAGEQRCPPQQQLTRLQAPSAFKLNSRLLLLSEHRGDECQERRHASHDLTRRLHGLWQLSEHRGDQRKEHRHAEQNLAGPLYGLRLQKAALVILQCK